MHLLRYIFSTQAQKSGSNILPSISEGVTIPKIIHQTFHTRLLPPEIQENVDNIKAMNPGWEYRFYDDGDIVRFIADNYDLRILNYFNRINPAYGAARADLFRYLLMYKCGGVYLDIKSFPKKPLDRILKAGDRYLLSNWKNKKGDQFEGWGMHRELSHIENGEFQQWHILAAPGHPFLTAVIAKVLHNIDRYNPGLHGTGKPGVLRLTGPIAYTQAIAPLLHLHKHRLVDSQSDLGFEYSIYGPRDNRSHKLIFRSHYSDLAEPIVIINDANKLLAKIIIALRRTKNSMLAVVETICRFIAWAGKGKVPRDLRLGTEFIVAALANLVGFIELRPDCTLIPQSRQARQFNRLGGKIPG